MTNVQGNQAPAKRQKMLKKFKNSSIKMSSILELVDTFGISYGVPGDLNRKFEHAPHCHEVCSPNLDKLSKAAEH
jgi:hypothetical protein